MLERAAEIVETENRPIQAAYFVSKKLQLWIQKGEFREAAEKAKKLIRLYQVRRGPLYNWTEHSLNFYFEMFRPIYTEVLG